MNQNQKELTYDESVKQVMQTLPPVIRSYLSQGKSTMVAKSLMIKYGLRIDQVSILEREIMLLLMGIENPDEFTQALSEEAKLEKKIIENIVQDINTQIFVPLRERMRGGEVNAVPSAAMPAAKSVEVKPPQVEPKPISIPTLIVPKLPSHFVSLEQQRSPISLPVRPALFAAPKPITSNTLLEDHEEPHIEFNKALVPPTPSRAVLSSTRPPQGINRIISEARPTPIAQKANVAAPVFQPKQIPPPVPAVAVPKAPPIPSKPYSTDPYREPIDEK